jgi:hypothetical protein
MIDCINPPLMHDALKAKENSNSDMLQNFTF